MINVSSNPEIYTNEILGLNATSDCLLKNFCKHITVGKMSDFSDMKKQLMGFEPGTTKSDKKVDLNTQPDPIHDFVTLLTFLVICSSKCEYLPQKVIIVFLLVVPVAKKH